MSNLTCNNNDIIGYFICKFRGYLYYFYNGIGGQFTQRLGGYFRFFFIMAEVGNLDTCLGVTLVYFHNDRSG